MANITVCVRFRPLSPKEKEVGGESVCVQGLDAESFLFKAEKEEEIAFYFDRVFYQDSEQSDVYEFLAMPIVQDTMNAINGTIITYGQDNMLRKSFEALLHGLNKVEHTGAGKTYSMEGPSISDCDAQTKGLIPRVVDGLFQYINSAEETTKYTIKMSMVEIYMEKVRDLFNLSKDNLQIKESRTQGIFLSGVTEVTILDPQEALRCLSYGIANRAVGETQMNMASSRSHCVYIFLVQQESLRDERLRTGKLVLVDLAGSEKVEKTGAEGRILDEARTINKSLSALGNVINALTTGKVNHIPYRDSKLTRIMQDALGGNSRTALLCCCSPSSLNASESLSTLRFGTRTKLIKTPLRPHVPSMQITPNQAQDSSRDRILEKLRESLKPEDVNRLEELFILEGILFDPPSTEDLESAYEDVVGQTILSLQETIGDLNDELEELTVAYNALKAKLEATRQLPRNHVVSGEYPNFFAKILSVFRWFWLLGTQVHG